MPSMTEKEEVAVLITFVTTFLTKIKGMVDFYAEEHNEVKNFTERQCLRRRKQTFYKAHGQRNWAPVRYDSWSIETDLNDFDNLERTFVACANSLTYNADYEYRSEGLKDLRNTCERLKKYLPFDEHVEVVQPVEKVDTVVERVKKSKQSTVSKKKLSQVPKPAKEDVSPKTSPNEKKETVPTAEWVPVEIPPESMKQLTLEYNKVKPKNGEFVCYSSDTNVNYVAVTVETYNDIISGKLPLDFSKSPVNSAELQLPSPPVTVNNRKRGIEQAQPENSVSSKKAKLFSVAELAVSSQPAKPIYTVPPPVFEPSSSTVSSNNLLMTPSTSGTTSTKGIDSVLSNLEQYVQNCPMFSKSEPWILPQNSMQLPSPPALTQSPLMWPSFPMSSNMPTPSMPQIILPQTESVPPLDFKLPMDITKDELGELINTSPKEAENLVIKQRHYLIGEIVEILRAMESNNKILRPNVEPTQCSDNSVN